MTDNQRKALEYLERYKKKSAHVRFLIERCKVQRSRAENATASIGGLEGWTGEWEGRCKTTNRKIKTKDKDLLKKPRKVYAPIARAPSSGKSREHVIDTLVEYERDYERAAEELKELADEMSKKIDQLCESPGSEVLKYTYITLYDYRKIAGIMNYSWQHVKRLHWESVEIFGARLKDEPK